MIGEDGVFAQDGDGGYVVMYVVERGGSSGWVAGCIDGILED